MRVGVSSCPIVSVVALICFLSYDAPARRTARRVPP
jgi:hypothetical protein